MKPCGKRQIKAWIRCGTFDEFRDFVDKKYQYYHHGMYSYELEEALLQYIYDIPKNSKARTHTHTKENGQNQQEWSSRKEIPLESVPLPPPPVKRGQTAAELRDQIIHCLVSYGIYEERPTTVLTGHLKQAISTIGNLKDNRSIQNWINFLVTGGVLKPITKQQFQVIYGIDGPQLM